MTDESQERRGLTKGRRFWTEVAWPVIEFGVAGGLVLFVLLALLVGD